MPSRTTDQHRPPQKRSASSPLALALVLLAGVTIGAVAMFIALPHIEDATRPPLDETINLRAETAWIATLGPGWGSVTRAGTLLAAQSASLSFPLRQSPSGLLVIDVEFAASNGQAANAERQSAERLSIAVNGLAVGSVRVAPGNTGRVLVPEGIVTEPGSVQVSLTSSRASPAAVPVRALALREIAALTDWTGHVDACSQTAVSGWAKAGLAPAPVKILRPDAEPVWIVPARERADLVQAGHPRDAGYTAPLTPPAKSGEKVSVVFPSGRHLLGSPCRVE